MLTMATQSSSNTHSRASDCEYYRKLHGRGTLLPYMRFADGRCYVVRTESDDFVVLRSVTDGAEIEVSPPELASQFTWWIPDEYACMFGTPEQQAAVTAYWDSVNATIRHILYSNTRQLPVIVLDKVQ